MKNNGLVFGVVTAVLFCLFTGTIEAQAQEKIIKTGIYIENMDVSGMSKDEASMFLNNYVKGFEEKSVTMITSGNHPVETTLGALGLRWRNPEIVEEAVEIGSKGNAISRYKVWKDLQREPVNYTIEYDYDVNVLDKFLAKECSVYDQPAKNASLTRENGEFIIVPEQVGYLLDVEASIDLVYEALKDPTKDKLEVVLEVYEERPQGDSSQLLQVTDVLGTYTTSFKSSNANRSGNVSNGCRLINGTLLYPGEEFSTYNTVAPFSKENGYYMAGSYMNGKVVDSLGGGICQVSTTLYNAVLLSELDVVERHNHSMIVSYVAPSADAAIAESAGKDFRFRNNTEYPIYIEGVIKDKQITMTIYGKETRGPEREVIYESKVLETTNPTTDYLYADPAHPIGYIVKLESAHVGKKAQLWKIVKENGVEVSRTQVNSSKYKMSPASYSVGVGTTDPNAYDAMIAAINSGSVDAVRSTASALLTPAPTE